MADFQILTTEAFDSINDIVGGVPTNETSTSFSYISSAGLTVKIKGFDLHYRSGTGIPVFGTITAMTVWDGTKELAIARDLHITATSFAKFAFGLVDGSHKVLEPDAEALRLEMQSGDDNFYGSGGDDWFYASNGHDSYYGGDGVDRLIFNGLGVTIEPKYFGLSIVNDGYRENDYSINSIEMIVTSNDASSGDNVRLAQGDGMHGMEVWLRAGNDSLQAGNAFDTIYGGEGNDYIHGGGLIDGGPGVDRMSVGYSAILAFWSADDGGHGAVVDLTLKTEQVRDDGFGNIETADFARQLAGSVFDDRFYGGAEDNIFWGDSGNDSLSGGDGNDEIYGNIGNDTLLGGSGEDTVSAGSGRDLMDGGVGTDLLSLWESHGTGHGLTVNLGLYGGRVLDDGYGNREIALNFEDLAGSDRADNLTGNALTNYIWGNDGNDFIFGGGGNDVLIGGQGRDSLVGGKGDDALWGYSGVDTLVGGAGADSFFFTDAMPASSGVDRLADVTHGVDKIFLPIEWSASFEGTTLTSAQFLNLPGAPVAKTTSQIVLYDRATGNLYFDADGSGWAFSPVLLARLSNHAALSWDDFALYS